ncbi:hypothetical protein [Desulfoplanes sp.]
MNNNPIKKNANSGLLFFTTGSGALCLLSTVQKVFIGTPLTLKGYFIPIIAGGSVGMAIGFNYLGLLSQNKELLQAIEKLQESNQQLMSTNQTLEERTRHLEESFAEIKRLQGIIPICAECKKVQDEEGQWKPVELYIQSHSGAQFSHGICPDCAKKLYPDLNIVPRAKTPGTTE